MSTKFAPLFWAALENPYFFQNECVKEDLPQRYLRYVGETIDIYKGAIERKDDFSRSPLF